MDTVIRTAARVVRGEGQKGAVRDQSAPLTSRHEPLQSKMDFPLPRGVRRRTSSMAPKTSMWPFRIGGIDGCALSGGGREDAPGPVGGGDPNPRGRTPADASHGNDRHNADDNDRHHARAVAPGLLHRAITRWSFHVPHGRLRPRFR